MAHDVFISYSSSDKPIADGICAHLESAGLRCWVAPRDITPGEDWPGAISRAIVASRVMVLVFSQSSNKSEDVSRELYLAANNKVIIVPFKIEDVQPEAGKAYYLGRTHWLDAMNPPTLEQIGMLVERVRAILALPPEPKPGRGEIQTARTPNKALAWYASLSWKLRAISFIGLAILLVAGLLVVPELVQMAAPAAPTPAPQSTATLEPKPAMLFRDDFSDVQFENALPPYVRLADGRCKSTKVAQIQGSLVFRTQANTEPDCYAAFEHQPYPLAKSRAIEFGVRAAPDTGARYPSFGIIIQAAPDTQDKLQLICGFLTEPGCVVKSMESPNDLWRSNTLQFKPGVLYQFRLEFVDTEKVTVRILVNGVSQGDYSLPADSAAAWRKSGYWMGWSERDMNVIAQESVLSVDYVGIEAR